MSGIQNKDVVVASGILLFSFQTGEQRVLLLHDPHTGNWGPPKGIQEEGESQLDCALRELHEETGLNLKPHELNLGTVYKLNYHLKNGLQKVVHLYSSHIGAEIQTGVSLSNEHDQWCWANLEMVETLIVFSNLNRIIKQCFNSYEYCLEAKAKRDQNHDFILDCLQESLIQVCKNLELDWFVGGSFASNEETWSPNGMVSDIDLVAYGEEEISPRKLHNLLRAVEKFAAKLYLNQPFPRLSTHFLTSGSRVIADDPFWSYFEANGYGLMGSNKRRVTQLYQNQKIDISYHIFRLYWYSLLEPYGREHSNNKCSYSDSKKNILAYTMFCLLRGKKFRSYNELRGYLVTNQTTNQLSSRNLFASTLSAFSLKLDYYPESYLLDQSVNFKNWMRLLYSLLPDQSDSDTYLLFELLLGRSNGVLSNNDLLNSRVISVLGREYATLWSTAVSEHENELLYLLISLFRLKRWPEQTKWSSWRYKQLIPIFAESIINPPFSRRLPEVEFMGISPASDTRQFHPDPYAFIQKN